MATFFILEESRSETSPHPDGGGERNPDLRRHPTPMAVVRARVIGGGRRRPRSGRVSIINAH
jgi:hypothetical protein